MAMSRNKAAISLNGNFLAISSPDGCLRIWDTSLNVLKQEYTPSSHLSATCSALSWGPCKQNVGTTRKKGKKFKSDENVASGVADLQLIAMGTLTGSILLYSYSIGDLHTELVGGHNNVVNDISWYSEGNALYSCSNDHHIVAWSITTGKIKSKWKADKEAIHSLCVIDANNLLSASNNILWWDIEKHTVIKKFNGHATEVFRLLPVKLSENSDSRYFISCAVGDRIISAWHLDESNSHGSVASFSLSDEPESVEVSESTAGDQCLLMSVVTKEGIFHAFEQKLNGRKKKPIQPKMTVHIVSKASDPDSKPYPVPILASKISDDLTSYTFAYGSFLKPIFENFEIPSDSTTSPVYLLRDISLATTVSLEDNVTRIKKPDTSNGVKVLAPGYMTTSKAAQHSHKKRKQKNTDVKELPMEDRLIALDLSKTPEIEEPSVRTDSMLHLLLQGLQSKDNKLLTTVLQCGDEAVISSTVSQLPIQSITVVLRELYQRLQKQEPKHHPCLRWLKALLAAHLPYLMSCKDISEFLGPISQLFDARIELVSKMAQLKGCLEILLAQSASIKNTTSFDTSIDALSTYQSESSEASDSNDEDIMEDGSVAEEVEELSSEESEDEMDV